MQIDSTSQSGRQAEVNEKRVEEGTIVTSFIEIGSNSHET